MNENNELLSGQYSSVELTTSSNELKAGEFMVNGYFLPAGQLGLREKKYSYIMVGRDEYDRAIKRALNKFGRSISAANFAFDILSPSNQASKYFSK